MMNNNLCLEARINKSYTQGKISMIQVLLSSDTNINKIVQLTCNCQDSTPLHRTTSVEDAKKLIEGGADVNKKNEWGETPLHNAVAEGKDRALIKLLIDSGADINVCSGLGRTPLHCALKRGREADKKVIKMLINRGAEIDVNTRRIRPKKLNPTRFDDPIMYDRGDVALTKAIIKFTLLHGYSESYCDMLKSIYCHDRARGLEVEQYVYRCISEVERMQEEKVCDEYTLFEMVTLEPEELKRLPVRLGAHIKRKYPVYNDKIEIRYKNYIKRVILFKAIHSSQLVIFSKTSNKNIYVDSDCLSIICENLCNSHLWSFVSAFISKEHISHQMQLLNVFNYDKQRFEAYH